MKTADDRAGSKVAALCTLMMWTSYTQPYRLTARNKNVSVDNAYRREGA